MSDAESPRQRTVAELLAAHGGDAAVTGRRARRRAAEDAAGPGQAVADAPARAGRPQPAANGSGGADAADPAPSRNGNATARPAAGSTTGPGLNGNGANGPGPNGAVANGVAETYGAPYVNGADNPTYRAPYGNGGGSTSGGPATRPGDAYSPAQRNGAPSTNGPDDTTYGPPANSPGGLRRAPYVNGTTADVSATSAGPATWPADAYGTPYPNGAGYPDGAGDTGYNAVPQRPGDDAYGSPYGDDNGSPYGRGAGYPDTGATSYRGGPPRTPDRSVLREPVPREPVPRDGDAPVNGQGGPMRRTAETSAPGDNPRARPTEQMPRLRADRTPMLDPGLTGPIDMQRFPQADVVDEGPSTAVGMAPAGAEAWHRERTSRRADRDSGPATAASEAFFDDEDDDEGDEDLPAGLADEPGPDGASPVGGQSTGQAWAAVVAQWIAGAIGGAALWVGFRFLWRDLPVVALAAAVLVTVGLVLLVRALMRNDDRRTTLFAVLVGLLLTVSPAILVLLGR